jgi:hypothetical protein
MGFVNAARAATVERRQRRASAGIVFVYMATPRLEHALIYGNRRVERVKIGITSNPKSVRAQAKLWGLGFEPQVEVWGTVGKLAAERVIKRMELALRDQEAGVLGGWYEGTLKTVRMEIAIAASVSGVEVFDEAEARRRLKLDKAKPRGAR